MEVLLSGSPGELRFTLMQGDKVCDIALWRPGAPDGWGERHVVRVLSRKPAFEGVFVQLANRQDGFLTTKIPLQEGQLVTAQIIRSAQKNKGPRLKLLDPEPEIQNKQIGLIESGPHPLEALLAQAPGTPLYYADAGLAAQLPVQFRPHLTRRPHEEFAFLEDVWAELLTPSVMVGSLMAHICPTPALTAIDLDAADRPDFTANIEAFGPLLRQIRLRNLSGTILIDPAGLRLKKRAALIPFLARALEQEKDPLNVRIMGLTPSGLIEMTRPSKRPPLSEAFASPIGQGLAILRQILKENLPGTVLYAPAAIIQALDSDPQALISFERERGTRLALCIRPAHPTLSWSLS